MYVISILNGLFAGTVNLSFYVTGIGKIAIIFLQQVSIWAPELVAQEHDAKQAASVLFYVVDSQTRSTGGMIEVAYLIATGRCVVLVAQPYKTGQMIMGESITLK